ncbi:cytochrome C biogenesis protein [Dyella sp. GSA-30]|uniref:tetratricopeptide repeat protein n=1 Tax=Dyella sp. GSA-30 TaxID=2994496 RepID=UPI002491922B|nr:cytochrome C biogenesis protein [Dyella sp. GSA-30]
MTFYVIAAAMIALALFALIYPLIKANRRHQHSQNLLATIVAIAVLLPAAAIYLYAHLGSPAALDESARNITIGASVERKQQDIQKWLDKAHEDDVAQRVGEARDAYAQVLTLDPQNTVAMVGWVEADMSQQAGYAVDTAARRLLEQAIALDPDNQRALWLVGISQFQQKDYAAASATWRHLLQLLDAGTDLAQSVTQQIAIADEKANLAHSGLKSLR